MALTFRFFIQRLFCTITCCLAAINVFGQGNNFQQKKDSLLQVIKTAQGKEKLDAYSALEELCFYNVSDDKTLNAYLSVTEDLEKEAQKQGNIGTQIEAKWHSMGIFDYLGKNAEMEKRALENLQWLKSLDAKKYKTEIYQYSAYVYTALVRAYCGQGKYEEALTMLQTLYNEAKTENNQVNLCTALQLTGFVYLYQNRFDDAANYYRQAIETGKMFIKKPVTKDGDTINIKNIKLENGYSGLFTALTAAEHFDDELFATMKEWEEYIKQNPNRDGYLDIATNYASLYIEMKEWDKAEIYCNRMDSIAPDVPIAQANAAICRADICIAREQYKEALKWINRGIEFMPANMGLYTTRIKILSHIENAPQTYAAFEEFVQMNDSLHTAKINAQLDELRTKYEVDKITAEKERNHNYFLFALGGCILLAIALGIWIYLNRKIARKNRTLAQQIKELTAQQEARDNEILAKTTFIPEEEKMKEVADEDGFCPESRMDKLCIAIRDALLKDKAYRNPALTREDLIEQMGTSKNLFVEAFQYCFGMSFTDYVNILRLKDAILLLGQTDLSIEAISEKIGFGTIRTFQRQFQAKYNMTPKDYRYSAKKE